MNKKHAFIGLVVVCLLVCALVWAWQAREDKKVSSMPLQTGLEESFRDLKVEIAKRFAQAADLLNKDAPKTLQPGIVLKRVEVGEGPSMTYHYVLENGAAALDTAPVIERTCSVPEMRDYMQYGVFYTYVYEDGQGKEIMSLTVDEAACEAHEREKAKKDVNGTGQAGSQASGQ